MSTLRVMLRTPTIPFRQGLPPAWSSPSKVGCCTGNAGAQYYIQCVCVCVLMLVRQAIYQLGYLPTTKNIFSLYFFLRQDPICACLRLSLFDSRTCLVFIFKDLFLVCVPACMFVHHACALPVEATRGCKIPWSWNYL